MQRDQILKWRTGSEG
uniref:Uncharacterized protein n=1 Tax=Anguilla anguilla TaxID=7936 RepID=A0A0E9PPK6_ANGAN